MPGEVCPKCGVAVVPGYVKCPKCQAPLPRRAARVTIDPGGTAVPPRPPFPYAVVIGAVVVIGGAIIGLVAWHGHRRAPSADAAVQAAAPASGHPTDLDPGAAALPPESQPGPMPADAVAAQLEQRLKHLHLWATVEVGTSTVDVRSDSCSDPAIQPVIAPAIPRFKAAGLTRLRCVEESGTIVFTRDL